MKRFSLGRRLVAAGFGVAMAAVAVPAMAIPYIPPPPTVWYPTDTNVNTTNGSYLAQVLTTDSCTSNCNNGITSFGIFAPTNTSLNPTQGYLAIDPVSDTIDFSQNGSNWDLTTAHNQKFTLHGSNHFLLGATMSSNPPTATGSWVSDYGYSPNPLGSQYYIHFATGTTSPTTLVGTDLAPVPIPAPVWLFASGLIGIVGVARRRRPTDGVR